MTKYIDVPLLTNPSPNLMTLHRWLVDDGAHVVRGQGVFELLTNNEVFVIPSFCSGQIKILSSSGIICGAGDVIGEILSDDEYY